MESEKTLGSRRNYSQIDSNCVTYKSDFLSPEQVVGYCTDFIAEDQPVYSWGFYLEEADNYKHGKEIYFAEIVGSAILGLVGSSKNKNKRIRERGFTIWTECHVANAVPGYYGSDYGKSLAVGLTPILRYQFGDIYSYTDSSSAGHSRNLMAEGNIVTLQYRRYTATALKKSEVYDGLKNHFHPSGKFEDLLQPLIRRRCPVLARKVSLRWLYSDPQQLIGFSIS